MQKYINLSIIQNKRKQKVTIQSMGHPAPSINMLMRPAFLEGVSKVTDTPSI